MSQGKCLAHDDIVVGTIMSIPKLLLCPYPPMSKQNKKFFLTPTMLAMLLVYVREKYHSQLPNTTTHSQMWSNSSNNRRRFRLKGSGLVEKKNNNQIRPMYIIEMKQ